MANSGPAMALPAGQSPTALLVENIVDTFGMEQIWYDVSILGMFAVGKCRGHINFVLSKMYEEYFQLIYHLVHLN